MWWWSWKRMTYLMHCLISNVNCQAVLESWESDLSLDSNDEANFAFLKQWIWWSFCKRKLVWPWKSWKQKIEFRVKTYVWKHQYKIDNEITLVFSVTRRSRSDESHWLTHSLTESLSVSIDFTDVTLVSDDTYRRLCWCGPDQSDGPDESYLVMKVI